MCANGLKSPSFVRCHACVLAYFRRAEVSVRSYTACACSIVQPQNTHHRGTQNRDVTLEHLVFLIHCTIVDRLQRQRQAAEAAKAREISLLKMAAATVTEMEAMVKKRLDAEMEAMALEDRRSRQVRTSLHDKLWTAGGRYIPQEVCHRKRVFTQE